MSQDDSRVVAWLCEASDGVNIDAVRRSISRDQYARCGRTITPLVPLSLLAEAESALAACNELSAQRLRDLTCIQSRLDAVSRLADRWDQFAHGMRYNPAAMPFTAEQIENCAAELRAALGGESPANDEERK